jgi:hypothetical protein
MACWIALSMGKIFPMQQNGELMEGVTFVAQFDLALGRGIGRQTQKQNFRVFGLSQVNAAL